MIDVDEILPGRLWVGACISPDEAQGLKELGINHVVNLQTDADMLERGVSIRDLARAYDECGIALTRRPTPDFNRMELLRNLGSCVSALHAAILPDGNRVFLHCTAGINRAPTVAAAWFMRSGGVGPREALDYVASRRRCSIYLDILELYYAELQTKS